MGLPKTCEVVQAERFSQPKARKANQALVDLIGEFVAQRKATPTQIALADADGIAGLRQAEPQNQTVRAY